MKLSVSNIAWAPDRFAEGLDWIQSLGCEGVELAPNLLWPEPLDVSVSEQKRVARLIRDRGLDLVGFHALLFTRPDLVFFGASGKLNGVMDYIKQLGDFCAEMGGSLLILGSPRNRSFNGTSRNFAWDLFVEAVQKMMEVLDPRVTLCIEPLPKRDTDFICSSGEGAELVRRVNHPRFCLHLDVKALVEMGEPVAEILAAHGPHVRHVHVGDPGLTPPGSTGVNHFPYGVALKRAGYDHYVSIEIRRIEGDERNSISRSINYVRSCYFGEVP